MADMTTKKHKIKLAAPARAFRDCLPLFQAFGDTGRQDIILIAGRSGFDECQPDSRATDPVAADYFPSFKDAAKRRATLIALG